MFIELLEKINPEAARRLNYDKIMSAQIKRDTLFIPSRFSYESGQQAIEYFSEEERAADALFKDIRSQNQELVKSIMNGRREFIAPMLRIKMIKGSGISFTGSPLVTTCLLFGG